jgi:hypothetical protein
MTDKSDFVLVFDDTASFDGVLQEVPIGLFEGEEGDVICYLLGNGQNSAMRSLRRGQVRVDFSRRFACIDIEPNSS